MTSMFSGVILCVFILLGSTLSLFAAEAPAIVGSWHGTLQVGATALPVVVHITGGADGTLAATLDSLSQGAFGIPINRTSFTAGALTLTIAAINGSYQGTLAADGKSLTGTFTQNGANYPLTLTPGPGTALSRPQVPQAPYPYHEEEVSYRNPRADITLAGAFTAPRAAGRYPAVLLIAGSGPNDRDEYIAGHRPFLVLADYLTRHGMAVLRVDKRGVGHSGGDAAKATTEDYADDALAGVAYLKTRTEVNPRQIGLIGHSEGGLIAPMVATRSDDVAFLVLLAGPGVPGEQILLTQSELLSRALGKSAQEIEREHRMLQTIITIVKNEPDAGKVAERARQYLQDELDKLPAQDLQKLGDRAQFINGQIAVINSPWMRFFMSYDPRPTLHKVAVPLLALNGSKDLQVAAADNLPVIQQAVQAGGNKDVTTRVLPELNHLFQTCKTGSMLEYATIEETFAPSALRIITEWIIDHCAPRK